MPELFSAAVPRLASLGERPLCRVRPAAARSGEKALGHFRAPFYALTPRTITATRRTAPLALCRDRGDRASRPAAYLALCTAPHAAVENLRRWRRPDSPAPTGCGGGRFLPRVPAAGRSAFRCVMAHHLGMSALRDRKRAVRRRLRRWFFRPGHGPPTRALRGRSPPAEKPRRVPGEVGKSGARRERRAYRRRGRIPSSRTARRARTAHTVVVTANRYVPRFVRHAHPASERPTPWEDARHPRSGPERGVRRRCQSRGEARLCVGASPPGEALSRNRAGIFFWERCSAPFRARIRAAAAARLRSRKAAPDAVIFGFEPVLCWNTRDLCRHPGVARLGLFAHRCAPACSSCTARRGEPERAVSCARLLGGGGFFSDFRQFPPAAGGFRKIRAGRMSRISPRACRFRRGSACNCARALRRRRRGHRRARRAGGAPGELRLLPWRTPRHDLGHGERRSAAPWTFRRAHLSRLCAEGARQRDAGRAWRLGISGDLPVMVFDGGETARKPRSVSSGGTRRSARAAEYDRVFSPRRRGLPERATRGDRKRALEAMRLSRNALLPAGIFRLSQ